MPIKVYILVPCDACDGEAYVPIGEATSHTGQSYARYQPCPQCQGSGNQAKWIPLSEFIDLLEREATRDPMQPDYMELARKLPVTQYADSREAAGI